MKILHTPLNPFQALRSHSLLLGSLLLGSCLLVGCAGKTAASTPDAVSSASQIFYQSSSLTGDELLDAIRQADGSCTIATVNADGSPNLIVSVPGVADDDHLVFGWADNATKENLLRDKQAVIAYYIYDKDGAEKNNRHRGARLVCQPEEDEAVLRQLEESSGASHGTFLRIVDILPIG